MSHADESNDRGSRSCSSILVSYFSCKSSRHEGKDATDPGLIADVIPHVCKYLSISDIKQCRRVCQAWNYAASPVLKVRAMVVVPLYAGSDDPRKDGGIVEKFEFGAANVYLKTSFPFNNDRQLTNPKIQYSIGNLKSIGIEYLSPPTQWQKELCEKMLLDSAPTLEKFKFGCVFTGDFPTFDGKVFPKLKKLQIHYGQLPGEACRQSISRAITEALPNLQHLKIDCRLYFVSSLESGGMKLPGSLNSLVVNGDLDARVLACLMSIDLPLKKLVFGQSFHVGSGDPLMAEIPTILYKLLAKHSPTLEKLYIRILNRDPGGEEMSWKFPIFPVLKKFEIFTNSWFTKAKFETSPGSGDFGDIDYNVCFPVLENLNIFIRTNVVSNLAAYVPKEGPVVESVKVVDIKGICPMEADKRAQLALYQKLMGIFPNASLIEHTKKLKASKCII